MSPERPEQDDFLEDEEHEEYEGQRSIFATGWFRAVLVLLVLAVIAVIAVPLIGGWFEPTPPPKVTTKSSEPTPPVLTPTPSAPATPPPAPTPPSAAQAPSTPATTPPASVGTAPSTPSAQPAPPAVATPAPAPTPSVPARPEIPAASAPTKAPEKAKAPERTAAATSGKSAAKATGNGHYWVQVGAFKESHNAEGLAKKLRAEGFSVQIAKVTRDEPLHVVRVGGYPDRSRANAAREELQGKGHTGFVTSGPAK